MRFREIQELLEQNRFMAGPLPLASLGKGKGSGKDFSKSIIRGVKGPGEGPIKRNTGDGGNDGNGDAPDKTLSGGGMASGAPPTDLPEHLNWITSGPPQVTLNHPSVQDAIGGILMDLQRFFDSISIPLDYGPDGSITAITPRFVNGQWVYDISIQDSERGVTGTVGFRWDSDANRFVMEDDYGVMIRNMELAEKSLADLYSEFMERLSSPDNPDALDFSQDIRNILLEMGLPISSYNDPEFGRFYLLPHLTPEQHEQIIMNFVRRGLLPHGFKASFPESTGLRWEFKITTRRTSKGVSYPAFEFQATGPNGPVGPTFKFDNLFYSFNAPGVPLNNSGVMSNIYGFGGQYGSIRGQSGGRKLSTRQILKRFASFLFR